MSGRQPMFWASLTSAQLDAIKKAIASPFIPLTSWNTKFMLADTDTLLHLLQRCAPRF
jgi:hypothetical protein